jgi:hypothetical protein
VALPVGDHLRVEIRRLDLGVSEGLLDELLVSAGQEQADGVRVSEPIAVHGSEHRPHPIERRFISAGLLGDQQLALASRFMAAFQFLFILAHWNGPQPRCSMSIFQAATPPAGKGTINGMPPFPTRLKQNGSGRSRKGSTSPDSARTISDGRKPAYAISSRRARVAEGRMVASVLVMTS